VKRKKVDSQSRDIIEAQRVLTLIEGAQTCLRKRGLYLRKEKLQVARKEVKTDKFSCSPKTDQVIGPEE